MIQETTAPDKITWLKIDDVYPYECNNKIHRQPEITKIANSIKEFGWTYPILIDENNIILAGHKRLLASKQLGLTEVPTIQKTDLTDAQKRAYRIIDNKSSEESEYDPTNLTLELDEIKALDFDISKFINLNFDLDKIGEIQDLDVQEDDYDAEPPAEPKTKLGNLYQLGNHRLLCGDSTKEEDVKKLMNENKADLLFTDPPYNVSIEKKTKTILNSKNYTHIENDDISLDDFKKFLGDVFKNANSFLKDNASYYVFSCQGGDNEIIMMMMRESGIKCRHQIIWVKDTPVFSMGRLDYDYKHEPILYGWKKKHNFYRKGDQDKSVWEFKRTENKLHPTMKPVKLIENALLNSTKLKDIVLDLFGGSGSTLIACEQLNRNCYMMELDPAYCDVIVDRWEKFTGKKAEKINGE